jgi:hypothetical protein
MAREASFAVVGLSPLQQVVVQPQPEMMDSSTFFGSGFLSPSQQEVLHAQPLTEDSANLEW